MKTMKTMKNQKGVKTILKSLFLATVLFFSSCSSSNTEAEEEQLSEVVMKDFVENIQGLSIPSGLSNSSNQHAKNANSQFQSLKTLASGFTTLFSIPENAVSSKTAIKKLAKTSILNTQTYTWTADGATVKYTISEQSDRYTFTYHLTSNVFTGKFMDGYQMKDGSYAEVNMYSDNVVVSTIKWWIKKDSLKIELSADNMKMVLESNTANNSGELKVYYYNTLEGAYKWNSDGSGSYTDYNANKTYTW